MKNLLYILPAVLRYGSGGGEEKKKYHRRYLQMHKFISCKQILQG